MIKLCLIAKFGLILAYVVAFIVFYKDIGPAFFLIALVPIAVIGLISGLVCGILSGVIFFLINIVLSRYASIGAVSPGDYLLVMATFIAVGALSGRFGDLMKKVRLYCKYQENIAGLLGKYEFTFNRSNNMVTLINKEYKYEMANAAFCSAINKNEKTVAGKPVSEIWGGKIFTEIIKPYLDRCFNGEEIRYIDFFEYPVIGFKYFEVTCFPYKASQKGGISHAMVVTRDTTDKIISEMLLKANANTLGQGSPKPATTLFNQDKELKYTLVHNPAPFINNKTILGKTDFELFPANEAKNLVQLKRRVLDLGKPVHERVKFNISGKETSFDINIEPLKDISGNTTGITCCATDISFLKDSGRDSYSSEDKFSALANNLKSAVAVYEAVNDGEDFIIRGFNRRAEEIEKVTRSEIIGKSINTVFPYVKNFGLFDVLLKVWKTGEPQSHPATFYKDNRISGWRENDVFKLPTGEVVAVYNDISRETTAADELKDSEEKYRSLVENSNDPIFVIDYTGKFTFMNKMAAAYFNGVPEDFVGKTVWDIFPKEYADRHVNAVRDCIMSGKVILVTNPTNIMGREFWFNTSLQPVRDNTGKICMVQVVSRNITELKVMQNSLTQSESRVKAIINNIPDIAWLKDNESRFLIVNCALAKFFGYDNPAELVGKTDFDITPSKELAEHYRSDDSEVMKTGKRKRVVEQLIAKDGNSQWIETIKGPVYNEKGEIAGTAGIARDITQHKQMDEILRISEEKYRKLFEDSGDAIFIANGDGEFIEVNPAALKMFGFFSKNELKTFRTKDIYWDPSTRQAVLEKLDKEGCVKDYELELRRRDGKKFISLVSINTVKDKDGKILFLSGSAKDITGLKTK